MQLVPNNSLHDFTVSCESDFRLKLIQMPRLSDLLYFISVNPKTVSCDYCLHILYKTEIMLFSYGFNYLSRNMVYFVRGNHINIAY